MDCRTIAVLGVPLEAACSNPVYKSILRHDGLIISEYPPGYKIGKWSFRERNRIISALSFSTVVVEAPQSSGALITAEFSTKLKRDIYAIAGDITKSNLAGNLNLINSGIAQPIFSPQLWAESLRLERRTYNSKLQNLSNPILDFVSAEPLSFDTLLQKSQLSEAALLAELSKLCAQGCIRKIFGQRYIRL
jgi:DNA processing protein